MKVILIIASTILLLLCNWVHAVEPIYQLDASLNKAVDFYHLVRDKSNSDNQIINLIEDLDIDSEEDFNNGNDLKSNKDQKHLFQNCGFLPARSLNNFFAPQIGDKTGQKYYSILFKNANPIYILNRNLRI
jgi:hypothetical protein